MQQTTMKQVPFTAENIDLCRCAGCPVQSGSSCVKDKMQAMGSQGSMPSPADTPKVYCSQGTASCGDLDFSQQCVCPTCEVWTTNGLSNYKYCQHGSAAVQG